jgi:hypothetical protein
MMIIIVFMIVASLTMIIIYEHNMFIVQATRVFVSGQPIQPSLMFTCKSTVQCNKTFYVYIYKSL